eukprot:TRINITY_DN12765_c0_g2_i1.p1 TRINITY_DN12765_c0_g2~~TRINITY_DN12765_c0_g2_i1.p1  ORF type:complete len:517 (+),score=135.09 TRINITY_DN12765_c0_g2_i1:492-2042(+)
MPLMAIAEDGGNVECSLQEVRESGFTPARPRQLESYKKDCIVVESEKKSVRTERSDVSSSKTSGLLIDCGRMAIKKAITAFNQVVQIIPSSIQPDNIKGIKIDGHTLTDLSSLPHTLLILNVSNSHIISLQSVFSCKRLRLLNASYNFVKQVEGISVLSFLSELYVSYNLLASLNQCSQLQSLQILEAAGNPINKVEDLAELARVNALKHICLDNTPLTNTEASKAQLSTLLAGMQVGEVRSHSKFARIKDFAFGTAEDSKEQSRAATELLSEEKSRYVESENEEESRMSRKSHKTDISSIMKNVASKNCTVISTQNVCSLKGRSDFNNPIAAMMIAPPQDIPKQPILRKIPTAQSLKANPKPPLSHSNKKRELRDTGVKKFKVGGDVQRKASLSARSRVVKLRPRIVREGRREEASGKGEDTPSSSKAAFNQCFITPSNMYSNTESPVNLRDLLKKTCEMMALKKQKRGSLSTINNSRVNAARQVPVKKSGDGQPIVIDLRPERKLYLRAQCNKH